jgi:hypothetical protein
VALYLDVFAGDRPLAWRRWPVVADALMRSDGGLGAMVRHLRQSGFWEESSRLGEPDRLARAELLIERGQTLTVFDRGYPVGWLDRLGSMAPPALWRDGDLPVESGSHGGHGGGTIAVVGSRGLDTAHESLAVGLGHYLADLGYGVVSGGALGADRLAMRGAYASGLGRGIEILPCGIDSTDGRGSGVACRLSPFGRESGFNTSQAMARNRMIYAWSGRTVVVHARAYSGGTWAGATDALRRGLGSVIVLAPEGGDGLSRRGLAAMGAKVCPVTFGGSGESTRSDTDWGLPQGSGGRGSVTWDWGRSPLAFLLMEPLVAAQPTLFGFEGVREHRRGYDDHRRRRVGLCPDGDQGVEILTAWA